MTIDQKAENYINKTELNKDTYKGDIITCYECAYLQAESDMIFKLFKTEQFSISKIAEMLELSVTEVRNALNQREWV